MSPLKELHLLHPLICSYRSSIVAKATSSASLLMLSMNGVQRPVWVSASSWDIFVPLSDCSACGLASLHFWDCSELDCCEASCCWCDVGGVSDGGGAAAWDWCSCFPVPSLSDSTSSSTMSGLSLTETTMGWQGVTCVEEARDMWLISDMLVTCKQVYSFDTSLFIRCLSHVGDNPQQFSVIKWNFMYKMSADKGRCPRSERMISDSKGNSAHPIH